jgi:Protein of unknown function (DUF2905)
MDRTVGLMLMGFGALAILIGLLVWSGAFGWFGRLPGDIRIEGQHTRVYIPITSMILVSLALTLILSVFRRFF